MQHEEGLFTPSRGLRCIRRQKICLHCVLCFIYSPSGKKRNFKEQIRWPSHRKDDARFFWAPNLFFKTLRSGQVNLTYFAQAVRMIYAEDRAQMNRELIYLFYGRWKIGFLARQFGHGSTMRPCHSDVWPRDIYKYTLRTNRCSLFW